MFTLPLAAYTVDLGINDLLFGLLILVVILFIANSHKTNRFASRKNEHYKYYMLNVYFKLFFALLYGAIYMFYYQGGDTIAYFKGAQSLNNLMWENPVNYWNEMMDTPTLNNLYSRYNYGTTGYPPGWIYKDQNSFFVSKIISVFMVFIGQSYVVITLLFGYITALASWKLFELVRFYKLTSDRFAAIALLFIPSVAFWCAGISKDTVVLISVFYIVYHFFGIANGLTKTTWRSIALICLYGFILYSTRSFMLFTVLASLMLAMSVRMLKNYRESFVILMTLRLIIIIISVGGFLIFLRSQGDVLAKTATSYLTEAEITQGDFANNETYGEHRYDLGITDFSPTGMLKVAPQAILTAMYRPGIWEARSPLLLISGLETSVFIYLTLLFFFKGNFLKKIRTIRYNEFLVFSLLFALILAYFAGFTSGLFGVLVRFKAPLLPFLLIVLVTNTKLAQPKKEDVDALAE